MNYVQLESIICRSKKALDSKLHDALRDSLNTAAAQVINEYGHKTIPGVNQLASVLHDTLHGVFDAVVSDSLLKCRIDRGAYYINTFTHTMYKPTGQGSLCVTIKDTERVIEVNYVLDAIDDIHVLKFEYPMM